VKNPENLGDCQREVLQRAGGGPGKIENNNKYAIAVTIRRHQRREKGFLT